MSFSTEPPIVNRAITTVKRIVGELPAADPKNAKSETGTLQVQRCAKLKGRPMIQVPELTALTITSINGLPQIPPECNVYSNAVYTVAPNGAG
jgi:hypothetical protein